MRFHCSGNLSDRGDTIATMEMTSLSIFYLSVEVFRTLMTIQLCNLSNCLPLAILKFVFLQPCISGRFLSVDDILLTNDNINF